MSSLKVLNCQSIEFDAKLSMQRIEKARLVFGENILKRMLGFSLFLLGAKRSIIAHSFSLPEDTVRSMIKSIMRDGVDALKDRRKHNQQEEVLTGVTSKKEAINISLTDSFWQININGIDILIPRSNQLQFKTILLSLSNNKLISKTEAASLLSISSSQIAHLENELLKNDIPALIDKRVGQQKDYKFTPELKSEIIIQFSANAALGKSTSSSTLSRDIQERTKLQLSSRSIRHHLSKLGLKAKSKQLFDMIGIKKNSSNKQ